MGQNLLEIELVDQVAADRTAGVVLAGLGRFDGVARRQEPNPAAALRQTECGGIPSDTSSPFASACRMHHSLQRSPTAGVFHVTPHVL